MQLLVFRLDDQRYGLRLSAVSRVERAVEITPLPQAPPIILGIIDIHGKVVPVCNLRKRFGRIERDINLADFLVVADTSRRRVALPVDSVEGLADLAEEAISQTDEVVPGLAFLDGVAKTPDGMILIHDLDRFLSLEEEQQLGHAMTMVNGHDLDGGS
jgi:purine-binding chemotaxis protein CheW